MKETNKNSSERVEKILNSYPPVSESLLMILEDIQQHYNYLPEWALKKVADYLNINLTQVFAVASFYNAFSLKPKGKHIVQVCLGTACHVRGGAAIVEELEREFKVKCGTTKEDGSFSLEAVNCLGACALGPVMVVDGKYFGNMTPDKARNIIKKLLKK